MKAGIYQKIPLAACNDVRVQAFQRAVWQPYFDALYFVDDFETSYTRTQFVFGKRYLYYFLRPL